MHCESAEQHADDRDEELNPEETLGKTNSVLRILIQKESVIINHVAHYSEIKTFHGTRDAFRPAILFCLLHSAS